MTKHYMGRTGDKLRNRITIHNQQVRDPSIRQIPLSTHLYNCYKIRSKIFDIFPFYKFKSDDVSARLTKEKYF